LSGNGEIGLVAAYNVTVTRNLVQTNAVTGCSGYKIYGLELSQDNSTTVVDNNWVDGLNGQYFSIRERVICLWIGECTGHEPKFWQSGDSIAPSCGGTANVPACMQTLIANFTPLTQVALSYGYQPPSAAQVYDPLFPRWLCNVNVPSGLVTMGLLSTAFVGNSILALSNSSEITQSPSSINSLDATFCKPIAYDTAFYTGLRFKR